MATRRRLSRREVLVALAAGAGVAAAGAPAAGTDVKRSESGVAKMSSRTRMPTLYLPHGGGPCFFMDWTMGPKDTWERMRAFLAGIRTTLPSKPRALLIVSAHWEEPVPTVTAAAAPSLYYDYYGFPPHTYELKWPAPGHPALALRVQQLLESAGFPSRADGRRGLDHGVFIPLKVAWPEADIPSVQLSLMEGLDPAAHLRMGRALEPLRDEGVLIVGSGMSYHNMRAFMTPAAKPASEAFDAWLARSSALGVAARDEQLCRWSKAPSARASHPREEHLLPLMVVAGAAGQHRGEQVYRDEVMGSVVSAVRFG